MAENKVKKRNLPTSLLWILVTFLILAIGLAVIAVSLGLRHPYFKVDKFEINGNIIKSDEEILEEISSVKDESIFSVKSDQVKATIENMGNIESVEVKKVMPDKLKIDIVEDEYIGYIQVDNGYLLIGANLKVEEHVDNLSEDEKDSLIKISNASYDVLSLGSEFSSLDREVTFLNDLINHVLRKITKEVDFITESDKVILKLKSGTTVEFGELKETDYKIALVEKVISDLQSKDISAKEIILDGTPNPIVVTEWFVIKEQNIGSNSKIKSKTAI